MGPANATMLWEAVNNKDTASREEEAVGTVRYVQAETWVICQRGEVVKHAVAVKQCLHAVKAHAAASPAPQALLRAKRIETAPFSTPAAFAPSFSSFSRDPLRLTHSLGCKRHTPPLHFST
jgi:hypothetical protein